jgi:hypothetical protein
MFYVLDAEKQRYETSHLMEKVALPIHLQNILWFFQVFRYQHLHSY